MTFSKDPHLWLNMKSPYCTFPAFSDFPKAAILFLFAEMASDHVGSWKISGLSSMGGTYIAYWGEYTSKEFLWIIMNGFSMTGVFFNPA